MNEAAISDHSVRMPSTLHHLLSGPSRVTGIVACGGADMELMSNSFADGNAIPGEYAFGLPDAETP